MPFHRTIAPALLDGRVHRTLILFQCACRQISPLVATALLGKLRSKMTTEQQNTVDALKKACPEYAVMRSLVMSFRTILRTGKIKTLPAWMNKATASGIYKMNKHRI